MSLVADSSSPPYCGAAPVPGDWVSRWNFDPVLIAAALGIAVLLWRNSDASRHRLVGGALALAFILYVSPFCALSSALFSARVTHHVLLISVLVPLLVYALPAARVRWQASLVLWTGLQAITFWLWHSPGLYAAALSSDLLYWVMQITLVGTATGFWVAVRHSSVPAAIAALLVSTVQMGLLGAILTFAQSPFYLPHFLTTQPWGMDALQDQQLAGLIMWAPSVGLYLGAALVLVHRWLAQEERELTS